MTTMTSTLAWRSERHLSSRRLAGRAMALLADGARVAGLAVYRLFVPAW